MTEFKVGDMVEIVGTYARGQHGVVKRVADGEEFPLYVEHGPQKEHTWFRRSSLVSHPFAPEPEITVRGHKYRLVEPEAPEPKAGQIWVEDDDYILVLDEESDGGLDAVELTRSYPGMVLHNRFNGKGPRPTFVANSLREALESGKLKVSDL